MEIDTAAPVITRDEIVVHAPIQTIWRGRDGRYRRVTGRVL